MFEKNDKYYKIVEVVLKISWISLCVLAGISFFVFLIFALTTRKYALFLSIGFGSSLILLLYAGLTYVFGNLMLSRIYDLKAIRDKIYGSKMDYSFYVEERRIV